MPALGASEGSRLRPCDRTQPLSHPDLGHVLFIYLSIFFYPAHFTYFVSAGKEETVALKTINAVDFI